MLKYDEFMIKCQCGIDSSLGVDYHDVIKSWQISIIVVTQTVLRYKTCLYTFIVRLLTKWTIIYIIKVRNIKYSLSQHIGQTLTLLYAQSTGICGGLPWNIQDKEMVQGIYIRKYKNVTYVCCYYMFVHIVPPGGKAADWQLYSLSPLF